MYVCMYVCKKNANANACMYQHDLLMLVAASAEIAVSANHGNMVE